MTNIDFGRYVRAPRITGTSGVILSIRILRAAPKDPTPAELEALEALRSAAAAVQDAVAERHRNNSSNLRGFDRRFDGSWAALHGRVAAWTRLYDEPEEPRAVALLANVFPSGLQFLTSSYEEEWFHSRMLLERIEQEDLLDEFIELAGERFVLAVQAAHAALGQALRLNEDPEPDSSMPSIGEQVIALAEAIADYGRILSGGVNKNDPDSRARFLAAVAPIDAYRSQNRRSSSTATDDDAQAELEPEFSDAEAEAFAQADAEGLDIDSPLPPVLGG